MACKRTQGNVTCGDPLTVTEPRAGGKGRAGARRGSDGRSARDDATTKAVCGRTAVESGDARRQLGEYTGGMRQLAGGRTGKIRSKAEKGAGAHRLDCGTALPASRSAMCC